MKTIDLEFEEYPDDTYTVTVSPIPLSAFDKVSDLYNAAAQGFIGNGTTDGIRALVPEFTKLAKPTLNGKPAKLGDADPNLILAVVRMWHGGVRNVPFPLLRGSSSSEPSPER